MEPSSAMDLGEVDVEELHGPQHPNTDPYQDTSTPPLSDNGNWSWRCLDSFKRAWSSPLPKDSAEMLQILYVPMESSKKLLESMAMPIQMASVPASFMVFLTNTNSSMAKVFSLQTKLRHKLPLYAGVSRLGKQDWVAACWMFSGWICMLVLALLTAFLLFGQSEPPAVRYQSLEDTTSNDSLIAVMPLPKLYRFVKSEREPIYSYSDPPYLGHIEDSMSELSTVLIWKRSFLRYGWMPTLLSMADAARVEGFQEMKAKLSLLPTVNPPQYELSCYLRWIAMAGIGGGYLCDYNILNYGVVPPQRPLTDSMTGYDPHWPMLTSGKAGAYLEIAKAFASTTPENIGSYEGRPHTSDMFLSRTVYQDIFTISNVSMHQMFHLSYQLFTDIFGNNSPYSRSEKIRRINCYQAVSRISPVQVVVLPVTEATTSIVGSLNNALNECLQLAGGDGRKPDIVIEGSQVMKIVLLAPTILASLLEHHETYLRQTSTEREFCEYTEYLLQIKDTNEAPIQMITNQASPLMEKIRSASGILDINQNYNDTELLQALAQEGVFVGFLDQPRETLEIFEYEVGFFFDSATRAAMVDLWTLSWAHMSLLLNGVHKDFEVWISQRLSHDELLLQAMQKQFAERLVHVRRIQELEREPFITASYPHSPVLNN